MKDTISRQGAIDELVRWDKISDYNDGERNMIACCIAMLSALPSAQPDVPDTYVGDMISRQAAIDEAYAVIVDDAVYDVVQVETLEGLPSVDAVEVVRCKDSKWWNHNTDLTYCDRFGTMWVGADPDDFCSFAERETDE